MIAVQSVIHPNVLMTKSGDLISLLRVQDANSNVRCLRSKTTFADGLKRRFVPSMSISASTNIWSDPVAEIQTPRGQPIVDKLSEEREHHLNQSGRACSRWKSLGYFLRGWSTNASNRHGLAQKFSLKQNLVAGDGLHRARDLLLDGAGLVNTSPMWSGGDSR
jgi:hypothetical protein